MWWVGKGLNYCDHVNTRRGSVEDRPTDAVLVLGSVLYSKHNPNGNCARYGDNYQELNLAHGPLRVDSGTVQ